jgi:hypothetical protein
VLIARLHQIASCAHSTSPRGWSVREEHNIEAANKNKKQDHKSPCDEQKKKKKRKKQTQRHWTRTPCLNQVCQAKWPNLSVPSVRVEGPNANRLGAATAPPWRPSRCSTAFWGLIRLWNQGETFPSSCTPLPFLLSAPDAVRSEAGQYGVVTLSLIGGGVVGHLISLPAPEHVRSLSDAGFGSGR